MREDGTFESEGQEQREVDAANAETDVNELNDLEAIDDTDIDE